MNENEQPIVIIGGAGLIGRTFVTSCRDEGYKVIVFDLCDEKTWNGHDIECELFVQVDINNPNSLAEAIRVVVNEYISIACVVNASYPKNKNYGTAPLDLNIEDFNQNINLHIGGYFLVMKIFSKLFIDQQYGNIINIASIQGIVAPKFEHYKGTEIISPLEYTASKSAIIAMSRYMAKYLSGKNIRINCISPGGIKDKQSDIFLRQYKSSCTSKGMLDPKDIVGTLLFLLSDYAKYINGQNIIVDDGWSL